MPCFTAEAIYDAILSYSYFFKSSRPRIMPLVATTAGEVAGNFKKSCGMSRVLESGNSRVMSETSTVTQLNSRLWVSSLSLTAPTTRGRRQWPDDVSGHNYEDTRGRSAEDVFWCSNAQKEKKNIPGRTIIPRSKHKNHHPASYGLAVYVKD